MRKFRSVVESNIEPQDKEVLWIKDRIVYLFTNGEWKALTDVDPDDVPRPNEVKLPEFGYPLLYDEESNSVTLSLDTFSLGVRENKLGVSISEDSPLYIGSKGIDLRVDTGIMIDSIVKDGGFIPTLKLNIKAESPITYNKNESSIGINLGTGLTVNSENKTLALNLSGYGFEYMGNKAVGLSTGTVMLAHITGVGTLSDVCPPDIALDTNAFGPVYFGYYNNSPSESHKRKLGFYVPIGSGLSYISTEIDRNTNNKVGVLIGTGLEFADDNRIRLDTDFLTNYLYENGYGRVNVGSGLSIKSDGSIALNLGSGLQFEGIKGAEKVGLNLGEGLIQTIKGPFKVHLNEDDLYYTEGKGISIEPSKVIEIAKTSYKDDPSLWGKVYDGIEYKEYPIIGTALSLNIDESLYFTQDHKVAVNDEHTKDTIKNIVGQGLVWDDTRNKMNVSCYGSYTIEVSSSSGKLEVICGAGLKGVGGDGLSVNLGSGLSIEGPNKITVNLGTGLRFWEQLDGNVCIMPNLDEEDFTLNEYGQTCLNRSALTSKIGSEVKDSLKDISQWIPMDDSLLFDNSSKLGTLLRVNYDPDTLTLASGKDSLGVKLSSGLSVGANGIVVAIGRDDNSDLEDTGGLKFSSMGTITIDKDWLRDFIINTINGTPSN